MPSLRPLLRGDQPIVAPMALTPLQAALAEQTGFKAIYLGGGSMGYDKVFTEANLTLTEMCQIGMEIGSVSSLPLILDGTGGWGDPMHLHRTMRMTETAGFAAIEIEDQLLPKRAHHHVGKDHCIPMELMVDKIREAVRARRMGGSSRNGRRLKAPRPLGSSAQRLERRKRTTRWPKSMLTTSKILIRSMPIIMAGLSFSPHRSKVCRSAKAMAKRVKLTPPIRMAGTSASSP